MSEYRYEIKFSLDEAMYSEAISWILTHTSATKKFNDRYVNSLYFDDSNYSSVRDNIMGLPERTKYRLRWYNYENSQSAMSPKFELKIRNGRLGKKKSIDLPKFSEKFAALPIKKIESNLKRELVNSNFFLEQHLSPVLAVKYLRQYYEDVLGLRITIDENIEFSFVEGMNSKLNLCPKYSHKKYVMELKFDTSLKNYASKLLSQLNMTPTRHSKYLVGLAGFGSVSYL